jgi:cobalt-zinc-cadmium efflux system membrane fusion protein
MNRPVTLLLIAAIAACGGKEADEHGHEKDEHGHGKAEHDEGAKGEKHEDKGHEDGVVQLAKEAIARNKIRVDVAKGGRLGAGIDVPAEIGLAPDQIAHVTLLVPGRITEVKRTLGDKVKAGDIIALVESAELGAAQSARTQADAEVTVARKAFERQKELKAAGIGTQRTYDEAEAAFARAEADLSAANQRTRVYGSGGNSTTIALRAPLDGEIVERHASVGEVAEAGGEPLFVIANLATGVVEARVYERDVAAAVVGAPLRLTLQAYPGQSWESKLDYVSPRLDEKSRTLTVRATLKNDGRLKPGLFGTVTLLARADEGGAVRAIVPADAVQRMATGDIVFVPGDEDGEFKPVPVVVVARRGGEVELGSGLEPGARVVVEGAFVVKSELMRSELGEGHAH